MHDNITYDALMTLRISKEQSAKGAALLEQSGAQSFSRPSTKIKVEEEFHKLKLENKNLRAQVEKGNCSRCGNERCAQGKKCPANGKKCGKYDRINHFSRCSKSTLRKGKQSFGQIYSIVLMRQILRKVLAES